MTKYLDLDQLTCFIHLSLSRSDKESSLMMLSKSSLKATSDITSRCISNSSDDIFLQKFSEVKCLAFFNFKFFYIEKIIIQSTNSPSIDFNLQ